MVAERRPVGGRAPAFTEKMNVSFDYDELEFKAVDAEPNKQSNDLTTCVHWYEAERVQEIS